jgi:voltage-gated potassium channel
MAVHINIFGTRKLLTAILLFLLVLTFGVVGYSVIEGFRFLDALYMTVITVGTVGFKEVHELSDGGKIFTIILIITSIGIVTYTLSVVAAHFIEGNLRSVFRELKKKSGIKKMENHIIICGYGRNGRQAVAELKAHRRPFVVIDNKHDVVIANDDNTILIIEGDSTEDDVLLRAGVKTAKALITTLPNDADNLFVVLSARSLNPKLITVSRAADDSAERKLYKAGVNNVVMPERVGGAHMVSLVVNPDVVDFLDYISVHGKDETNLVEITCNCLSEKFRNKSIRELEIRIKTGANIIGFKTPDGEYTINPVPDTVLMPDSKLFVLGTPEQIRMMKEILLKG